MHKIVLHSPLKSGPKGITPFVLLVVDTPGEPAPISHQLMTDAEVDDAVDQLKAQLETLRKDAKKELKRLLTASLQP